MFKDHGSAAAAMSAIIESLLVTTAMVVEEELMATSDSGTYTGMRVSSTGSNTHADTVTATARSSTDSALVTAVAKTDTPAPTLAFTATELTTCTSSPETMASRDSTVTEALPSDPKATDATPALRPDTMPRAVSTVTREVSLETS